MSNKIYHNIKHSFLVLIIFVLLSNLAFAQEPETTEDYKVSKFYYDFQYFGFPFSANIGYQYRNDSSELFVPIVGLSYEYGLYAITLYADAKMEYRYKRFFFEIGFKQGLIPEVGDGYEYKNLESLGRFKIGYYFENVGISYNIDVGNGYTREIESRNLVNKFQVKQNLSLSALLHVDAKNTLSFDTAVGVQSLPYSDQHTYSFFARIPYTFFHYWGEFGIMPAIRYSAYFADSTREYTIGSLYLYDLMMIPLTGNNSDYNNLLDFLSYVHVEYKFFLRFLPAGFNNIFLVVFGDIGYGKQINKNFDNGQMLYVVGGGIGYSFFGTPFQLTVGVDQLENVVLNILITPIMHRF